MAEPLRERRIDALARAVAESMGNSFDALPHSVRQAMLEHAAVYVAAADGPLVEWLREQYELHRREAFEAAGEGRRRSRARHEAMMEALHASLFEIERTEK